MKRNILICLAAFAALMSVSCEKAEPNPAPVQKSPASITVEVDDALTKTVLGGDDGLSILWDGSESIGVFDGIAAAPNKFDAASAGASTSFTGAVSDGAENFIIFYPYQADATVSDAATATIQVQIPAVQKAVKNGFDPAAGLSAIQVTSLDGSITLKNQFALLKVNVDQDGVSAITVSATNRKLAGGIALKVSTNGGSNSTLVPTSNSVTLKNADDSALEQGIYYIAVRPSSTTSPYTGFKMEVVKNGVSKTRSANNDLIVARNHILSIGKVSALFEEGGDEPSHDGRYEAYMAGEDIVIGNVTINRSTHGSATLLTAEDAVVALSKSSLEAGGVYFLKAVGTGSFSNTNNPTITKGTYLLSDTDERVPVSMTNTFNLADNGVLGLQGLDLTISGKDYFFVVNKNTSTSFDTFVMDDCAVASPKSMISTNGSYTTYGIKHIVITRSDFKISVATNLVNISSTYTGISVYESFLFTDNTIYSSTGSNILTTVFGYTGTSGNAMVATVSNNLFYNTVNGGNFKHNTLASATATKNVFWAVDGTDPGANAKLWGMKTKVAIPTVAVTDNVAYGTLASGRKWVIADSTVDTGMEALTVLDTNPIATADEATGTFTMATGYESYGPQR